MRKIKISNIFSIQVPGDAVYTNLVDEDCIVIDFGRTQGECRFHLFQSLPEDRLAWCYSFLEEHVKNVIGPPFTTSVQKVQADTWSGCQGVTALDEEHGLVNRIIGSKVSGYGARIEFRLIKGNLPEVLVEAIESIEMVSE